MDTPIIIAIALAFSTQPSPTLKLPPHPNPQPPKQNLRQALTPSSLQLTPNTVTHRRNQSRSARRMSLVGLMLSAPISTHCAMKQASLSRSSAKAASALARTAIYSTATRFRHQQVARLFSTSTCITPTTTPRCNSLRRVFSKPNDHNASAASI
jgi:hypothetical protein